MKKWGWTKNDTCFRCAIHGAGETRFGTPETWVHAIAQCKAARTVNAGERATEWKSIRIQVTDATGTPREKLMKQDAALFTQQGPSWWPNGVEESESEMTEEERREVRRMRGNPTAATLITIPTFVQNRVRTNYELSHHRPAQEVLRDMQKVIIRLCYDQWTRRQTQLKAYRAEHDVWIQSRRKGRLTVQQGRQNKRKRTGSGANRRVIRRLEPGQRTLRDTWDPGPPT